MPTKLVLVGAMLSAFCGVPAAAEPKPVAKTYNVAELVSVDPCFVPTEVGFRKLVPTPEAKKEHWLIQLITDEIAPASWSQRGGPGTIGYFPLGQALVVNATAPVQEKVAELLRQLHDTKDLNVSVEVRFVSVDPLMAQRIAHYNFNPRLLDEHGRQQPSVTYLDDFELFLTVDCCLAPKVIHAPKLTMANGQTGSLEILDYQWFTTDVQVVQASFGSVIFVPHNHPEPVGVRLAVRPLIARNQRSLSLKLNAQMTSVVAVHLAPITSFITPVFDGGARGQPVPFTQYVQIPEMNRLQIDRHLIMDDGLTAVIDGWEFKHDREPTLIRWLREVPIVEEWLQPATDVERIVFCLQQFPCTQRELLKAGFVASWLMEVPAVQKWLEAAGDRESPSSIRDWLEPVFNAEFITRAMEQIPLIQEWSKPVRETQHIMVLVSPRIIRETEAAVHCEP